MLRWITVLLTLPVAVLAGGAAGAPSVQKVTLVMDEMSFTPSRVSLQAGLEELDLVQRLPDYREYMRQVPRFFPRLG